MSLKVAFHTLGCKVNQYETEAMAEQFKARGYEIVGEEDFADIYVINTCTVTNLADRKSRQYIRRMKRVSKEAFVAVTGCYSQVKPEELTEMPEVDLVTGNGEKNKLIDFIEEGIKTRDYLRDTAKTIGMEAPKLPCIEKVLKYDELIEYTDKGIICSMENRTRAYIKIQEGCDRFCAYCLIPFARGHVRSRDPKEIVEEAKALIEAGFREIVLTGINTALYGTEKGFIEKYGLAMSGMETIIRDIDALPGEFRIRLSSLEPTVVNAEYVAKLIKYKKLCPHLHLSIQSGSNSIIKAMNRHYTRDEYLDIVKVLRDYDSGYGITTDIIVGFPGETEADFEDSLDMVEKVKFAKVHAFKYSKRSGTVAGKLPNQVSGEIKNLRSDKLIEASDRVANAFFDSIVGTTRECLFEEFYGKYITGYADNYVRVYAKGSEADINKLVKVKLLEKYKDGMKGEIVNG